MYPKVEGSSQKCVMGLGEKEVGGARALYEMVQERQEEAGTVAPAAPFFLKSITAQVLLSPGSLSRP